MPEPIDEHSSPRSFIQGWTKRRARTVWLDCNYALNIPTQSQKDETRCNIHPTTQKINPWEKSKKTEQLHSLGQRMLSSTSLIFATLGPSITYSLRNPDWLSLQDTITNAAPGKLTSMLTLDSEMGNSSAGNCSGAVCNTAFHNERPQAAVAKHLPLLFSNKILHCE